MSLLTIFANRDLLGEVVNHLDPWSVGNLYASSKHSHHICSILKNIDLEYGILTGISSFAGRAKAVDNKCVDYFNATHELTHYHELTDAYGGYYDMISSMVTTLRNQSENSIVKAILNIEHVEQMRCLISMDLPLERWRKVILGVMLEKGNAECLILYLLKYNNNKVITWFSLSDFKHYKSSKMVLPLTPWLQYDTIENSNEKKRECTFDEIALLFDDTAVLFGGINIDKRIFRLLFNSLAFVKEFPSDIMHILISKCVYNRRYDLIRVIHNTVTGCFKDLADIDDLITIICKLNDDGQSELMKLMLRDNAPVASSVNYAYTYGNMVDENIVKNNVMNLRVLLKYPPIVLFFTVSDNIISMRNKSARIFKYRVLKSSKFVIDDRLARFTKIYSS